MPVRWKSEALMGGHSFGPHSYPLGEFVNGSSIAEDATKLKGTSARVIADWLAVYRSVEPRRVYASRLDV
jgi:hypothetical protein